ncbi:glycine zipper 2TM domain-containing protein [Massilia sp. W12]|uniref:glycine zipper 2TM domain-containing protein n=1 Tax=Massilia sp. W12 TaxID=3126507 RepID=UPI0030CEC77C
MTSRLHPLHAAAAASVILVSLLGAAAITGILPSSNSSPNPHTVNSQFAQHSAAASVTPASLAPAATPSPQTAPSGSSAAHNSGIVPPQMRKTQSSAHQPKTASHSEGKITKAEICHSCGTVQSISPVTHEIEKTSGVGAVAGAVLGGVLGNQVGGGNGKKIATVAGAIGGGLAGNEIEKKTRSNTTWNVKVKMEDGSVRTIPFQSEPAWRAGDAVRVENGQITARG